jgi:hypothetical protein
MDRAKPAPFAAGMLMGAVFLVPAALVLRDGSSPAMAQAGGGPATAGNLTLVSGMSQQGFSDSVFILSVDPVTNHKHVAVYTCVNGRSLKLVAARDITWDLRVAAYKNEGPSVEEVKKGVEEAEAKRRQALERMLLDGKEPPKPAK